MHITKLFPRLDLILKAMLIDALAEVFAVINPLIQCVMMMMMTASKSNSHLKPFSYSHATPSLRNDDTDGDITMVAVLVKI